MKILVLYQTRGGTTREAAERIAAVLREKPETTIDIMQVGALPMDIMGTYDMAVVGTPIFMGRWMKGVKGALKAAKKLNLPVALFAVAGVTMSEEIEGKKLKEYPDRDSRRRYAVEKFLDPVCGQLGVDPYAKTAFGGVLKVAGKVVTDSTCDEEVIGWAEDLIPALHDRFASSVSLR